MLEKQDQRDVPRIKKNIDDLEGFGLKNLKNQINDENKKSQAEIFKIKTVYDVLQKQIDQLNSKMTISQGKINNLNSQYMNDDLERSNEITSKLQGKLDQCSVDTNGEDAPTLQSQKRAVLDKINKMVTIFNENNKMIKDSNKYQKGDREMEEIVKRNKQLQKDCQQIVDDVKTAMDYGAVVDKRIDALLEPAIQEIRQKYDEKNKAVDECDELFDRANAEISSFDKTLSDKMTKLDAVLA